jgi:glyoxylase-like metal-dependent hydrolase (beta-lactamase superfamily II)
MKAGYGVALALGAAWAVAAPAATPMPAIELLPVAGNITMAVGPRSNATLMITPGDGVLVVDAMDAGAAPALLQAIRNATDRPILLLVNTGDTAASVGGNGVFAKALGSKASPIAKARAGEEGAGSGVSIIAHEALSLRLQDERSLPAEAMPDQTWAFGDKTLHMGGEGVRIIHVPAAITAGDSITWFRGSDVISAGAVLDTTAYPAIDHARGGTLAGTIKALNLILDLIIPGRAEEGGTMVIPGRGRLCNQHDVLEYRDMLVIVRDRVAELAAKGMSLEQVKRSRPALDYDDRYGKAAGASDAFIKLVYDELKGQP